MCDSVMKTYNIILSSAIVLYCFARAQKECLVCSHCYSARINKNIQIIRYNNAAAFYYHPITLKAWAWLLRLKRNSQVTDDGRREEEEDGKVLWIVG
jgi:hypothetical protein